MSTWEPFIYHTVDMSRHPALPDRWANDIIAVALRHAQNITLHPPHSSSREAPDIREVNTAGVGGLVVKEHLPWLYEAYHGLFCDLGSEAVSRQLYPAQDDRIGVVLNVMTPETGRYEVHTDTNPIQAVLHASGNLFTNGGQLVVSHDVDAIGVEAVETDAAIIAPHAGQLLFFDGRRPHYVRAIPHGLRVAAAMNYYDSVCREADRPPDLTDYLSGATLHA